MSHRSNCQHEPQAFTLGSLSPREDAFTTAYVDYFSLPLSSLTSQQPQDQIGYWPLPQKEWTICVLQRTDGRIIGRIYSSLNLFSHISFVQRSWWWMQYAPLERRQFLSDYMTQYPKRLSSSSESAVNTLIIYEYYDKTEMQAVQANACWRNCITPRTTSEYSGIDVLNMK
jgi:hypothetical protein